ncbi:MAG TPA: type II secretion system F family protein [Alphaproteobacteria bacterium]|nr:type II secretion system F family protein [Alphaproteobacteria bacterium]
MIYSYLAARFPGLRSKLRQAGIFQEPEDYIKNTLATSILLSVGMFFVFFFFTLSLWAIIVVPLFIPMIFSYFMKFVDVKIENIKKKIDEEIIFAGRFLIIGLESGVPIHKIFEDMEKNYEYIGFYFGEILNKVYLGTSMEDAISDTLNTTPSPNLRRILWQVMNSMKTGTEVGTALNSVIDQIVREQAIAVQEYGKKLSPLAMFYMTISIIVPSLGITMLVILATFIGLKVTMPILLVMAMLIAFVQFMFLSLVRSSRPSIST